MRLTIIRAKEAAMTVPYGASFVTMVVLSVLILCCVAWLISDIVRR